MWISGERCPRAWVFKSLAVNAVGSGLDYGLVLLTTQLLLWPTPLAAMLGVATGATTGFLLNRRFAFADAHGPMTSQAARYALAVGTLMVFHAAAVWALRDGLGIPLIPAKLAADLVCFAGTLPLVLRRFVFRVPDLLPMPARA